MAMPEFGTDEGAYHFRRKRLGGLELRAVAVVHRQRVQGARFERNHITAALCSRGEDCLREQEPRNFGLFRRAKVSGDQDPRLIKRLAHGFH